MSVYQEYNPSPGAFPCARLLLVIPKESVHSVSDGHSYGAIGQKSPRSLQKQLVPTLVLDPLVLSLEGTYVMIAFCSS